MSANDFELLPLDCPTCGAGVRAAGNDVVFYCVACRNGYRFDLETKQLAPVEVDFIAASHVEAERYLPFWLLPATITIRQRVAAGMRFGGIMGSFLDGLQGTSRGRRVPLRSNAEFVVPAFQAPLQATIELVRRYTQALPELGQKLGERLVGGCYGVTDARKLAHFVLVASEVDQPDMLKKLNYGLSFGEARLLGVPFIRHRESWRDSLYRIEIDG